VRLERVQPVLQFGDLPFTEGPSFDRSGNLLAALPAGGSKPTNCAFRGTSLYVTEDDSRGIQRLDVGVAGLPLFHERR
jgi:sugar lactone lactonase YvrE